MCGRYNLTDSLLVQTLLAELGIDFNFNIEPLFKSLPRYNIAPTEEVPVILHQENANQVLPMRWWLVPRWSKGPSTQYAMFNARKADVPELMATQVSKVVNNARNKAEDCLTPIGVSWKVAPD